MALRFDTIQLSDSGNHLFPYVQASSGYFQINTTSGYVSIGPGNSTYSHFYTDRSNYYFNKPVSFDGTLSAYGGDEDLTNWDNVDASSFRSKTNTGYYVSPASGSKLLYLGLAADPNSSGSYRLNMGGSIDMNANSIDYINQLHFNDNVRFFDDGNDSYLNFKFGDVSAGGIKFYDGDGNLHGYIYGDGDDNIGFLDADGNWAVYVSKDEHTALKVNDVYRLKCTTSEVQTFGILVNDTSVKAPIYYDSNDTNYYVDPASTSIVKYLGRRAHQEGLMVGGYNNIGASHAKTNPIFTIGSSYLPNETGLSNMYGIGYTRGDMAAMPGTSGWGMYVAADGNARIFLDGQNGGVGTASASWRAPIFYDSSDTTYYVDPNATTALRTVGAWQANDTTWSGEHVGKIQYHSNHWYMQTTSGVLIRNASGTNNITLGSNGIGTANASWRSPIFYDSNNTNYYIDPASTSKTSINIIDGRLTIGQSTDAGSTYRLYTAAGGQVYFGGHLTGTSATFNGTIDNGSNYANLGNVNFVGIGNSPKDTGTGGGTGSGSGKLLGFNELNGSGRASATLGVNDQGIVMEYEKIFTFKVEGSGWLNRKTNIYKLIQAPGADKMIVVDEFLVYIDYETRTGISYNGVARPSDTNAYVVGFYATESGQSISTAAHGVGGNFYTLGVMPRDFMANSNIDRGYYRDVPVHQSALIPNRSLFWKTARDCTTTSNAPGGPHYIKIKYRIVDISDEFSDNGVNHKIDTSNYHGQYAHSANLQKDYTDAGSAVQ